MPFSLIPMVEWVWMGFGSISTVVHCFVLYTIFRARQSSSGSFFRGPFFTLVLIQGFHEILEFLTVNLVNRFRKYRIIEYEVSYDNNVVEFEWYFYFFLKTLLYFGHIEIAANRLSAFVFTGFKTYDRIWNSRTIIFMTLGSYLFCGGIRAVVYNPNNNCTTYIVPGKNFFTLTMDTAIDQYENMVDTILSMIAAILCCTFYVGTLIMARKHRVQSVNSRKQELMLLKCGLVTFFILLPSPIRSGVDFYSKVTGNDPLYLFVSSINMITAEAMCVFHPWLLILSCSALRDRMLRTVRGRQEEKSTTISKVTVTRG